MPKIRKRKENVARAQIYKRVFCREYYTPYDVRDRGEGRTESRYYKLRARFSLFFDSMQALSISLARAFTLFLSFFPLWNVASFRTYACNSCSLYMDIYIYVWVCACDTLFIRMTQKCLTHWKSHRNVFVFLIWTNIRMYQNLCILFFTLFSHN